MKQQLQNLTQKMYCCYKLNYPLSTGPISHWVPMLHVKITAMCQLRAALHCQTATEIKATPCSLLAVRFEML